VAAAVAVAVALFAGLSESGALAALIIIVTCPYVCFPAEHSGAVELLRLLLSVLHLLLLLLLLLLQVWEKNPPAAAAAK
jgi:hypothetical protein